MYWIYKQTNYYPIFHLISGSHWVLLLGHFHRRDEPQDLGPRVCPSPRQLLEKHVEHHGLCGRCDRVGAVLLFNNIDLIICLKKLTTFNEQYLLVNENVFAKLVVTSVTRWQHTAAKKYASLLRKACFLAGTNSTVQILTNIKIATCLASWVPTSENNNNIGISDTYGKCVNI